MEVSNVMKVAKKCQEQEMKTRYVRDLHGSSIERQKNSSK